MKRRNFLRLTTAAMFAPAGMGAAMAAETFEVTRTRAEWKALLTPLQYKVMRKSGTERSGSSPLDANYAEGTYHCAGCDLAVYSSSTKYDSGTGWPSFW